jgi:hypothetical protein
MEENAEEWARIIRFFNTKVGEGADAGFVQIAREGMLEFDDVADFVWKIPNFLDAERALEKKKLQAYFPLSGDPDQDKLAKFLRAARWSHESHKLNNRFPELIGTGNLFIVLALFEAYCLKLVKLIEDRTEHRIHKVKGQGISRIFNFYSIVGIKHTTLPFFEQLDCALKIRNCLVHAEGLLSWSRDEVALRKIVQDRIFTEPKRRSKERNKKSLSLRVSVVDGVTGDRIKITNDYVFDVVWYAKNYFIAAAETAHFARF